MTEPRSINQANAVTCASNTASVSRAKVRGTGIAAVITPGALAMALVRRLSKGPVTISERCAPPV